MRFDAMHCPVEVMCAQMSVRSISVCTDTSLESSNDGCILLLGTQTILISHCFTGMLEKKSESETKTHLHPTNAILTIILL